MIISTMIWRAFGRFTEEDRQGVRQVSSRPEQSRLRLWRRAAASFSARLGPCDVILLDTRYFRENVEGSFLGEQTQWLEASSSTARAVHYHLVRNDVERLCHQRQGSGAAGIGGANASSPSSRSTGLAESS